MFEKITFTLTIFICIITILFGGVYAHENQHAGLHDDGMISGSASVAIYESVPNIHVVSALSYAEAHDPEHPDMFIISSYKVRVHVGGPAGVNQPIQHHNSWHTGDLYDLVNDAMEQNNTPAGLAGRAKGNGSATEFMWIFIQGMWRTIPIWHQHTHYWEDEDNAPMP